MRRRFSGLAAIAMITAALGAGAARAEIETMTERGKLDTVTVYRGQALVTRLVNVGGAAGLREVIVSDLPAQLQPGSIFAEGGEGLVVRSVRYRERPVEQDIREEVRALDAKLRTLADEATTNQKQLELLVEQRTYLQKLEQFTAPTATLELTRGVLNADTLKSLSEFLLDSRQKLVERELELNRQQRNLAEQTDLATRERQVLTGDSSRRLREAVVFVEVRGDQGGTLRFGYLVTQATWSPSYNLRAGGPDAKDVMVEYNASIQQMSGEDWTDVAMTLSTATPALVAKAPTLSPLTISLSRNEPLAAAVNPPPAVEGYAAAKAQLGTRRKQLEEQRNQYSFLPNVNAPQIAAGYALTNFPHLQASQATDTAMPNRSVGPGDVALNSVAAEEQVLDLMVCGDLSQLKAVAVPQAEEVSVLYALPERTSLPSRSDQQLVQIAALELPASFYKVAVPMLTQHVYNEAAITNSSDLVLLAGPLLTYHASQFVGQGQIRTVSSGETFTVGLGIDSSLRAKRELANKGESLQGGNRVVDFTYRLAIENFGSQPAEVRLVDRIPTAKSGDVKLTLVQPGRDLSADPGYLQGDRKQGVLRWEISVPAHAVGVEQLTLDYQFRLEYDKQLSIAGLPVAEGTR